MTRYEEQLAIYEKQHLQQLVTENNEDHVQKIMQESLLMVPTISKMVVFTQECKEVIKNLTNYNHGLVCTI